MQVSRRTSIDVSLANLPLGGATGVATPSRDKQSRGEKDREGKRAKDEAERRMRVDSGGGVYIRDVPGGPQRLALLFGPAGKFKKGQKLRNDPKGRQRLDEFKTEVKKFSEAARESYQLHRAKFKLLRPIDELRNLIRQKDRTPAFFREIDAIGKAEGRFTALEDAKREFNDNLRRAGEMLRKPDYAAAFGPATGDTAERSGMLWFEVWKEVQSVAMFSVLFEDGKPMARYNEWRQALVQRAVGAEAKVNAQLHHSFPLVWAQEQKMVPLTELFDRALGTNDESATAFALRDLQVCVATRFHYQTFREPIRTAEGVVKRDRRRVIKTREVRAPPEWDVEGPVSLTTILRSMLMAGADPGRKVNYPQNGLFINLFSTEPTRIVEGSWSLDDIADDEGMSDFKRGNEALITEWHQSFLLLQRDTMVDDGQITFA